MIAGTGDGELLRAGDAEGDRGAVADRTDAEAHGLDLDAAIPEVGVVGGHGESDGAADVEVEEVVAGGGVENVGGMAVDADAEVGGADFVREGGKRGCQSGGCGWLAGGGCDRAGQDGGGKEEEQGDGAWQDAARGAYRRLDRHDEKGSSVLVAGWAMTSPGDWRDCVQGQAPDRGEQH